MPFENLFPCFLTFLANIARVIPTHLFKFLIFKYSSYHIYVRTYVIYVCTYKNILYSVQYTIQMYIHNIMYAYVLHIYTYLLSINIVLIEVEAAGTSAEEIPDLMVTYILSLSRVSLGTLVKVV